MAEQDDGDKTEEPSAKKLRESMEKGQFAKSREFAPLSVLVVGYAGFLTLSPSWGIDHQNFAINMFRWTGEVSHNPQSTLHHMSADIMQHLWNIMGIPFVLLWVLVVFLNLAHHRFVIPKEALKFDIKKIDPISNAKEKFFSFNPLVELFKSLLKLGLLGYIVWRIVGKQWTTFPTLLWTTPSRSLQMLHETVWDIFWGCIPMVIFIAILDFGYQWYDNRKKLMMSRQELKDEMKNTDGNPEVKMQQRKRAYEMLSSKVNQQVPQADVVVVNPTHFSVALRYDKSEADAPIVVAKGVDFLALRIRLLADQHDIPIVENPPLARGLYFQTKEGQQIPPDFYAAVAEVLAMIYRRRNQSTELPM